MPGATAHATPPTTDEDELLDATEFVAVDTETTGLWWGDRLVEVAAVRFRGGVVLDTFHALVHPEGPIPPRAVAVHKITDAMVCEAPRARVVLPQLAAFLDGAVALAHHAPFDEGILATELARAGLAPPASPLHCTLALARAVVPEAPHHSLASLGHHLGLGASQRHRALADAHATFALFRACAARLGPGATLRDLARAAGAPLALGTSTVPLTRVPHRLRRLPVAIQEGAPVELVLDGEPGERPGGTETRRAIPRALYARGAEAWLDLEALEPGREVSPVSLARVLVAR